MKIYKNAVKVTMSLDEFHEILEDDLFDELLLMIMELDDGSPIEAIFGEDYGKITENEYELDEDDDILQLFKEVLMVDDYNVDEEYLSNLYYSVDSDGDDDSMWITLDSINQDWGNSINYPEDMKVKRILKRYGDVK